MRLLPVLLLLLSGLADAQAAETEFVRIWPGWREADSFDRISEYFGRGESTGGSIVLRTHPDARAGYYFLVRVKNAAALPAAKFELSVIRPDSAETKVFIFSTALPAREAVVQLGLTGPAWPGGRKTSPVAWKLALFAADGRLLAEHKSFLWE